MRTMRTRGTHVGFDAVLDVWYPGHDIVQGGDVCDDGLLIWMGHVHICRARTQLKKNSVYISKTTTELSQPPLLHFSRANK